MSRYLMSEKYYFIALYILWYLGICSIVILSTPQKQKLLPVFAEDEKSWETFLLITGKIGTQIAILVLLPTITYYNSQLEPFLDVGIGESSIKQWLRCKEILSLPEGQAM